MKIGSFDIFDTVLTRRLSCPADVFTIVGQRLRSQGIRVPRSNLFRKLRIRCERWSRRFGENHEVLLPDIYALLGKFLLWSASDRLLAEKIEREVEAEFLHKTTHGLAAVTEARLAGKRIVFVSDMYLDSDFLKTILLREGIAKEEDLVIVSGEWKASKASGEIWPRLLEKLSITPDQIFHQGDHEHSDVVSPARYGISSKRLGTSVVSRWEQWDEQNSPLSVMDWGQLAAISRMSRAICDEPDDYWTQLGNCILGPLMMGFVTWLLERAKEDGITTLWFLSRDGWLFYETAILLDQDHAINFQYIGINRNQLRFALEGARPLGELFAGSRRITWRLVQERLQFQNEDMAILRQAVVRKQEISAQVICDTTQKKLTDTLESPEWTKLREMRASEAGYKARAYLAQSIADAKNIGIVDVGWHGRSQDMMQSLFPEVKQGYYFGLSHPHPDSSRSAWMFHTANQVGITSLNDFQRMIEALIGSDSGPLQGYKMEQGVWQPCFSSINNSESTVGREVMQKTALEFVKLGSHAAYQGCIRENDLRVFVGHNLATLLEKPDSRDLASFLGWEVTSDDAHQDTLKPVKGFNLQRLFACLAKKEPWGMLWPQAALKSSSLIVRLLLNLLWNMGKKH